MPKPKQPDVIKPIKPAAPTAQAGLEPTPRLNIGKPVPKSPVPQLNTTNNPGWVMGRQSIAAQEALNPIHAMQIEGTKIASHKLAKMTKILHGMAIKPAPAAVRKALGL